MGRPGGPFAFEERGSRILREWNEQRRAARAIAERQRRQMKRDWWSGLVGPLAGFSGAGVGRLTASLAQHSNSVNSDLDGALVILRARARALCANYDYARRFLSLVAANVVGPFGPTLQVRAAMSNGKNLDKAANDAIEEHWRRWGEGCDVRGQMTLPEMVRVVIKAAARDGEGLVRAVRGPRYAYGLALQLLEADRLDETLNQRLDSGNIIRQGVELDSALRPVAYWILTQHPGENFIQGIGQKHERVAVRDLYHLFVPERAEQVRGYTWMHAVLLRSSHLQSYEEAAVVAARIGAAKVGFFKRTGDPTTDDALKRMADSQDTATGALQMTAEPGEFQDLPDGYDLAQWNPEYPHQMYGDFVRACLRGFSAGVDVDYASMSNDRSSENYSSIRHGALESRDVWTMQQEWLIRSLMKPLYRDWLAGALLRGDITLLDSGKSLPADRYDKFATAARFQGRRWAWVDPKNDGEAAQLAITNGLQSRTEIAASQGRDFEDIVDELAQERAMMEAAGLLAVAPAAQPGDSGKESPAEQGTEPAEEPGDAPPSGKSQSSRRRAKK